MKFTVMSSDSFEPCCLLFLFLHPNVALAPTDEFFLFLFFIKTKIGPICGEFLKMPDVEIGLKEEEEGKSISLLLKECQETKLEYNETQLTSLLDQVIVHLESKSCTNQAEIESTTKDGELQTLLQCASQLSTVIAGILEKRICKIHESLYQSLSSSTQILLGMKDFFHLHMNQLLRLKLFVPKMVQANVKHLLDLYLKSRQPLLVAHLDQIYSTPFVNTQPTTTTPTSTTSTQHNSNTSKVVVMRLQEVLRFIMQIFEQERTIYTAIFLSTYEMDEPFLHYFYQHAIVRYKSLLKQRIIAIPNIEALHECILEIICKIEDSFLKKALFVNTFDPFQALLIQLWKEYLNQEEAEPKDDIEMNENCPSDEGQSEEIECPQSTNKEQPSECSPTKSKTDQTVCDEPSDEIVHDSIEMNRLSKSGETFHLTVVDQPNWKLVFNQGLKFFDLFLFFDNEQMQKQSASLLASILFSKSFRRGTCQEEEGFEEREKEKMLQFLIQYLGRAGYKMNLSIWVEKACTTDLIPRGFKQDWLTVGMIKNAGWREVPVRKLEDEYRYLEDKLVDL